MGIRVSRVHAGSVADYAGLRKNDDIVLINGRPVEDELEFLFFSADNNLRISLVRNGRKKTIRASRDDGVFLGLEFHEKGVRRCRNRCIFCFIDQLPKHLRKSLYVKDEDYRHSFLNGNYTTLCSTKDSELQKIVRLGLSPLYISVHATDPEVRKNMLGSRFAGNILSQLKYLEKGDIRFHAQIVVCPGFNDGKVLEKTIRDLLRFKRGLLSIAVVPVGLTKYKNRLLRPIDSGEAFNICRIVQRLSDRDKAGSGFRRLFVSDEMFIKAGLSIPGKNYYENYPQIENGVGLLRCLLDEWKSLKKAGRINLHQLPKNRIKAKGKKSRVLVLTSISAESYLLSIIKEIRPIYSSLDIVVEAVDNDFFGDTVTVTGLLTAKDVVKSIKRTIIKTGQIWDLVVIPGNMFNYKGFTLDGFSLDRIAKTSGVSVKAPGSLTGIVEYFNRYKI